MDFYFAQIITPHMEDAYDWVQAVIGEGRHRIILDLRGRVSEILRDTLFKHYTKHDINHSDRIIDLLGRLVDIRKGEEERCQLSNDEVFVLCLSALLHDISMQLPKAHGQEKEVQELLTEDLENLRRNHGEVSAEILRDTVSQRDDRFGLGILRPEVEPYVPFVARICEHHQSTASYNIEKVVTLGSGSGASEIRIGMLTGLFRLSDLLDCDHQRVSMERLERFAIPVESKLHWYACHYVDAVIVKGGGIKVKASWPESLSSSEIEFLGTRVIGRIEGELNTCLEVLWKNGIRLRLVPKVTKTGTSYASAKRTLPDDVQEFIRSKITLESPKHVEIDPAIVGKIVSVDDTIDWMSYWGMIGDPFIDYPLAYGSKNLVFTTQMRRVSSEVGSYLKGPKGELRLAISDRGQGKTTLFQFLEGAHGDTTKVSVIDVGDSVPNIRNVADLTQMVFGKIYEEINPAGEEYSPEELLDWAKRGRKRLICLDSLDRLPIEQDSVVRDFFVAAQHILTSLKQTVLLILSCSDRWANFLKSNELSYLGARNQWVLEKFSTKDARQLLEKRLQSTGLSFSDVFDDGCIGALHAMSKGNPRRLLQHAVAVCKYGASKKVEKIDVDFIRQNYQRDFESAFRNLLDGFYGESKGPRNPLTLLYTFLLEMERRNLNTATGWEYLMEILASGSIPQESVKPPYLTPLRYVTTLSSQVLDSSDTRLMHIPRKEMKDFFKRLRKAGFSSRDFVAFYATNPYLPDSDKDEVIRTVRSVLLTGDDVPYFEDARLLYDEVLGAARFTPAKMITRAWNAIENMLAAILIKREILSTTGYEARKEEIYWEGHSGVKRYKRGAGRLLAERAKWITNLFFEGVLVKKVWMESFSSLNWIMHTRNNIVRGRAEHALTYGEKELNLCRTHLRLTFKDLFTIYK